MKNAVNITLSIAIICSLFVGVFAVGNTNSRDVTTSHTTNPFEYAKAPEGVDAFIYCGYTTYSCLNADTSECVTDRLYVYISTDDSLIEISEEIVTAYTCTQTALYYVTADQKVYKTDYAGLNHEVLYQSTQGTIENLKSYFDTIYFIEDQSCVIHLDVASKQIQELWTYEGLYWAIMLNASQLIATTTQEDNYLIDLTTNNATWISNIEATNLITAAVKGTASNNARSTTETSDFNPDLTQENDVSFPLIAYDVDDYNHYNTFKTPKTWFHENGTANSECKQYRGSNQCKGFAKYVHDVYAHMFNDVEVDTDGDGKKSREERKVADEAWENETCITRHAPPARAFEDGRVPSYIDANLTPLWFNEDVDDIKAFFATLNTGAYVRYGKYYSDGDESPENGCHSIVFIARDDHGIWVYECNQKYTPSPSTCCGVFIEYYAYENLTKYRFVLNYVNHLYEKNLTDNDEENGNEGSHIIGCSKNTPNGESCAAYIRTYSGHYSWYENTSQHIVACCSVTPTLANHNGDTEYYQFSETQHMVGKTCCKGGVLEDHNYTAVTISYMNADYHKRRCVDCGYLEISQHTSVTVQSYVSTDKHRAKFNCCGGVEVEVPHTDVVKTLISSTQHRITFGCCNDYIVEATHTEEVQYSDYSSTQHKVQSDCCDGYVLESHNYSAGPEYISTTYHRVVCADCGYTEQQKHNNITVLGYTDEGGHDARLDCCDGRMVNVPHTDVSKAIINAQTHNVLYLCCGNRGSAEHTSTPVYLQYSATQHEVRFSCCTGEILEAHTYRDEPGMYGRCVDCGYSRYPDIDINNDWSNEIS